MTAADQPTTEPSEAVVETVSDAHRAAMVDDWGDEGGGYDFEVMARALVERGWTTPAPQPAADTEALRRDDWERRFRAADADANALAERVVKAEEEATRLDAVVTAQAETIARLHDVGTGIVSHRYEGDCPVGPPFSPTKRDRNCPACRALDGGAS